MKKKQNTKWVYHHRKCHYHHRQPHHRLAQKMMSTIGKSIRRQRLHHCHVWIVWIVGIIPLNWIALKGQKVHLFSLFILFFFLFVSLFCSTFFPICLFVCSFCSLSIHPINWFVIWFSLFLFFVFKNKNWCVNLFSLSLRTYLPISQLEIMNYVFNYWTFNFFFAAINVVNFELEKQWSLTLFLLICLSVLRQSNFMTTSLVSMKK